MDDTDYKQIVALVSLFSLRCLKMMYGLFSPLGVKFITPPFLRASNQISAPLYTNALINPLPPIDQFHMVILEGALKGLKMQGWPTGLLEDTVNYAELKYLKTLPEGREEHEYLFEADPDVDVSAAIGCKVEIVISFIEGLRGRKWPIRINHVVSSQRTIE